MGMPSLDYRFTPRIPAVSNDTSPQPQGPSRIAKTPNRRSLAKKKWWDEKRAREAKERGE